MTILLSELPIDLINRGELNMNTKVLNLTKNKSTGEQLQKGLIEPTPKDKVKIKELLTFHDSSDEITLFDRAESLTEIAQEYPVTHALIDGPKYFMDELSASLALHPQSITPIYKLS